MLVTYILGLGVALSQFYIFRSGIPQPAHYIILLAMIGFILRYGRIFLPKKGKSTLIFLFAFVVYQAIVNLAYFIGTHDYGFLMQLAYIIYGFLLFMLIIGLFLTESNLLGRMSLFGLLGLVVLFALPLLGLGEYRMFPRYNAFFNDPNQMAFWVLCVAAICIYYVGTRNLILTALIFFVTANLVLLTASRSGLVGFSILSSGFVICYLQSFAWKLGFKQVVAYALVLCVVGYSIYYFVNSDSEAVSFAISRVDIIDTGEQARIRGYTRIFDYPEYVIFGAGHGMDVRFDDIGTEIHSTWAGVLFYYGLPGFLLFFAALYSIIKRLALNEKLLFLAPLFYSFSTFGLRTPIFWIFLGFFYTVVLKRQITS